MTQLSPDSQLDTFRVILEMETRCQQVDEILARLKQTFLQSAGTVSIPNAVGALDELRWHLAQISEQLGAVEESIGIHRRPLQRERKPAQSSTVNQLRGTTATIPIPDLMALLGAQQKTGTLRIKAKAGDRFVLEVLDGSVVHAATDTPLPQQMLGNILVAQGKIAEEALEAFLSDFSPGSRRLGSALEQAGLVSKADLLDALEEQVQRLTQRMSDLDEAAFCFTEGAVSNLELRVRMNTTQLLLEAARYRDERENAEAIQRISDEVIAEAVEEAVEAVRCVAAAVGSSATPAPSGVEGAGETAEPDGAAPS